MSNTSDKGTLFGDGAAWVGMPGSKLVQRWYNFSLVSPSSIINMPQELYSINVVATFGVPLTTVGDMQKLINDIDAGKHDELLFELTNEDRMETLEALDSICNSIKVDRNNADVIPCKVSYADDSINLNVDESTIPKADLIDVVTIGIPSLFKDDFTKETIRVEYEWRPPIKHNDGFQMVGKKKKRKGKSKSTNGGQFTGTSVKHNVRYEPKATTSAPKKGTNLCEDEEDVENVYDESANLIQNTKAGGSSSFTACCFG
ncbi:hypothetical protein Tco_1177404 [Tanacetum coccineum]